MLRHRNGVGKKDKFKLQITLPVDYYDFFLIFEIFNRKSC